MIAIVPSFPRPIIFFCVLPQIKLRTLVCCLTLLPSILKYFDAGLLVHHRIKPRHVKVFRFLAGIEGLDVGIVPELPGSENARKLAAKSSRRYCRTNVNWSLMGRKITRFMPPADACKAQN